MEPAFCLSIWQGSLQGRGAGELGALEPAHLPARGAGELPRQAPGGSSGAGAPGSWQAGGVGQPCAPGALDLRSRKQEEGET